MRSTGHHSSLQLRPRLGIGKHRLHFTSLDNLRIVTGFKNSMLGVFNPGDSVLVDRGVRSCHHDGVFFSRVSNESYIKRPQRIPHKGVRVINANRDYEPRTITEGMDFEVPAQLLVAKNASGFKHGRLADDQDNGAVDIKRLILAGMLAAISAAHAGLSDAPVVFRSGKWKVIRVVDQMTDKAVCAGIYNNNNRIQLSEDEMYIKLSNVLESVKLRFGNQPAQTLRLATEMEKNLGSLIIAGADFKRLGESDRLRVEVSTRAGLAPVMDFNLQGFADVLNNIKAGCPPASNKQKTSKSRPAR